MTYSIQRPSNSETSPRNSSNEFCHFRASKIPQIAKTIQRGSFDQAALRLADEFPNLWKNHILSRLARDHPTNICAFGLVGPTSSVMVLVLLNWLALVQD